MRWRECSTEHGNGGGFGKTHLLQNLAGGGNGLGEDGVFIRNAQRHREQVLDRQRQIFRKCALVFDDAEHCAPRAMTPQSAGTPIAFAARQVDLTHNPLANPLRIGRLHHIGIGRTHARTRVLVLVDDLDIRIINATTGEILRALTLDPTRDYQPTGKPIGGPSRPYGPRKRNNPNP